MVLDTGAREDHRRDIRGGALYDATNHSESFMPPSGVVNLPYMTNGNSSGHFPSMQQQYEVPRQQHPGNQYGYYPSCQTATPQSRPPAPAPYPPLPRAAPTALGDPYASPGSGRAAAGHQGAVYLPLPGPAPQLVADYSSPVARQQQQQQQPQQQHQHQQQQQQQQPQHQQQQQQHQQHQQQQQYQQQQQQQQHQQQQQQQQQSPPPPPPPPPPPSAVTLPLPPAESGAASQADRSSKLAARDNWLPPSLPQPYWKNPPVLRDSPPAAHRTQAQQSSSGSTKNNSNSKSGSADNNHSSSSSSSNNDRCSGGSSRDPRLNRSSSSSKDEDRRTPSSRDPRLNRSSREEEGRTSASRSHDSNSNSRDHGRGETRHESSRTDVRRGGRGGEKEDRARGLEDILVRVEERVKGRGEGGRGERGGGGGRCGERGEGRGGGGGGVRWLDDDGTRNRDRRAQDDGYRGFRDDGRVRGGRDDRGSSGGGGGRGSDDRGRYGSRDEDERRAGGYGGPRRVGKSCPPPSAEKKRQQQSSRDGGKAVSSPGEGEDDELAAIMNKLSALDLDTGKTGGGAGKGEAVVSEKNYLSLEEYKAATAAGEMKPYKGTKYLTVDHRYADGWAYNPTTRRWIKVACQQKKAAIEAHPALVARLEMLENKVKLSAQRSQLLETKAEKILNDKTTRPTVALTTLTAPELIVFDTNWLIHDLGDVKCLAADVASRRPSTTILIPKEVLRELDRLKTAGRDETLRYNAREANRYLLSLLEKPLENGRKFPVVRGQEDTDLYRDDGYHEKPGYLRGDDSILNCCLFFTLGIRTPRKVTLYTGDNNFAIRAKSNGLGTESRPQCAPGRCRLPLCPAPIRPSPFARGPQR